MADRVRTWGAPALLVICAAALGGYLAFGMEHRAAYRESPWDAAFLYAHIAGGSATVVVGPFLLWKGSRGRRFVRAHRWLGRAYLVGVLFAVSGGLYATRLVEHGGALSRLAFATALVLWLLTGYLAYRRIRERRVRAHREWVVRNYAITASFLTHGVWVSFFARASASVGLDHETGRTAGDWWAFSANLAVAELLLLRGRLRQRPLGRWVGRSSGAGRLAVGGEGPPLGHGDAA